MKHRGINYLFAFGALILAVGLACSTISTPPAATQAPAAAATVDTSSSGNSGTTSASSGLVTFTDKNNYFSIDVPSDWTHKTGSDTNLYSDTFTSPDSHGFIESVVYDDGTPWTGTQNGKGALYLLNNYYSYTKKEGDIRISDDSIQKDGSERLTWTSKGGGYSGVSFFEVRKPTAFLMFTTWWDNSYADKYETVLDDVISSYRLP